MRFRDCTAWIAGRILRFLLFRGLGRLGSTELSGDARKYLVESFGGGHFLLALIAAILVLSVAGSAKDLGGFLSDEGRDGVIGGPFAAGAVIVYVIAQAHGGILLQQGHCWREGAEGPGLAGRRADFARGTGDIIPS